MPEMKKKKKAKLPLHTLSSGLREQNLTKPESHKYHSTGYCWNDILGLAFAHLII